MSRSCVLFLCTGNSCRSQMAEGWARHLKAEEFDAFSAGIETHGLNPNAVKVMAEVGIDITCQKSQRIDDFRGMDIDYVVTVCDNAAETCPVFPAKVRVVHHSFDDPPKLARGARSEEEALVYYRRVRDEIKEYVASLPNSLEG